MTCAVSQVIDILEKEKVKTIVKIEVEQKHHEDSIVRDIKKFLKDRVSI